MSNRDGLNVVRQARRRVVFGRAALISVPIVAFLTSLLIGAQVAMAVNSAVTVYLLVQVSWLSKQVDVILVEVAASKSEVCGDTGEHVWFP